MYEKKTKQKETRLSSLTKPQIFNQVCGQDNGYTLVSVSLAIQLVLIVILTRESTKHIKQMMRKRISNWSAAPLPFAWTYDTHKHTASVYHSPCPLRLESHWCVTCIWKLVSFSRHPSISGFTFSCHYHPGKTISCTNVPTIPPKSSNPAGNPANLQTPCTAGCWLQKKQFHALATFFFFFVTLLKSTFTDSHFTASTCMFAMAGWMVNKRWTCSRIKTLKWLPKQYTLIPDRLWRPPYNYLFFISTEGCCFLTEKKLKQNKTNKQQHN